MPRSAGSLIATIEWIIMILPSRFLRYFLIAAVILASGIVVIILQTAMVHPDPAPLDPAALQARADYHNTTVVPFMAGAFPQLLLRNAGVALVILLAPFLWVGVWWFRKDLTGPVVRLMQGTVCLLVWTIGYNSFPKIYLTYRLLPWEVVATLYLPHALPEMLAFVLAGTSAFLTIDALRAYLTESGNSPDLRPGDIGIFILGRARKIGLAIVLLIVLAAVMECRVTPALVGSAFEIALRNS